jgi:hypothetical protein
VTTDAGRSGRDLDPVRSRRARVATLARMGQRLGYASFLAALALLVIGYISGFTPLLVGITTAGLVGGCVLLAPSIIAGYGVRAAERDDRSRGI